MVEVKKDHIDIAWRSPSSNGGSPITSYIVEYRDSQSAGAWSRANQASLLETDYRLTAVREGKYYDIRVSAQNAAGIGTPTEVRGEAGGSRSTPGTQLTRFFSAKLDFIYTN